MTQPLLNRWKVSDLCDSNSPIYTVGKKAAIKEVFQLLTDKKILSVPIYDNRAGKYKTFVDILDILVYIVKIVGNDSIGSGYETISSHPKFTANCAELAGKVIFYDSELEDFSLFISTFQMVLTEILLYRLISQCH